VLIERGLARRDRRAHQHRTGNATAAKVQSETVNGRTSYRLQTDVTIETDAKRSAADSAKNLAALGLTRGGRADVAQTITSATRSSTGSSGLAATTAALATDLQVERTVVGVVAATRFH